MSQNTPRIKLKQFKKRLEKQKQTPKKTLSSQKMVYSKILFSLGAALTVISGIATTYLIWSVSQNNENARADLETSNPDDQSPSLGGGFLPGGSQTSSESSSFSEEQTPTDSTSIPQTTTDEELPDQNLENEGITIPEDASENSSSSSAVSMQSSQSTTQNSENQDQQDSSSQSTQSESNTVSSSSNSQSITQSNSSSVQSMQTVESTQTMTQSQTPRTGGSLTSSVVVVLLTATVGCILMIRTRKSLQISWK